MDAQTCRTCRQLKLITEFYRQSSIRSGYQTECKGCMRVRNSAWLQAHKETRRVTNGESSRRSRRRNPVVILLRSCRIRAKERGLPFNLTLEDIVIPDCCPVLGIPIRSRVSTGLRKGAWNVDHSPSIDRIDNRLGYTRDNIVIVSYRANRIKSDASLKELKLIMEFYSARDRSSKALRRGNRSVAAQARGKQNDLPELQSPSQEPARSLFSGEGGA